MEEYLERIMVKTCGATKKVLKNLTKEKKE